MYNSFIHVNVYKCVVVFLLFSDLISLTTIVYYAFLFFIDFSGF